MARSIHRLTVKQIEHAKKPLNDGGNLWLYPTTGKARNWIFRYMLEGRARQMGLGGWPDKTLEEARREAAHYRRMLKSGTDPIEHRNTEARRLKEAAVPVPTFTEAAARYIRAHRRGWSNPKHARQWVSTLKTYARPAIGLKPVTAITTEDVLTILKPIWTTRTETAKRIQGRIENILDFAAAMKWRDPVNPARWRGHLDKLLPRPTKVKQVRPQPAMPYAEVPAFMAELAGKGCRSAQALQLLILTAARTGEVLQAQWDEVDLEAAVWTIPASRMKARREHRIPLCKAAVHILEALPRITGNPYLFPGTRYGRPLSNMALLQLMRGMGYGVGGDRGNYVPHGFRSSFRDWSGEVSSFPRDVCEMALAHTIKNKAEAAYRRGDLFAKRRKMMETWAAWAGRGLAAVPIPLRKLRVG